MAASISRRFAFNLLKRNHLLNPNPNSVQPIINHYIQNPNLIPRFKPQQLKIPIFFSTSHPKPNPENPTTMNPENPTSMYPSQNPEFKHQEITGPTVDRDESALAEETRQVIESMTKTMYNLSKSLAVLGLIQLCLGAWISYDTPSSPISAISIQSFMAFGLPFSVAFILRRSVKHVEFFRRMEDQGRLQILTLSLQAAKNMKIMFLRIRGVSYTCVAGVCAGMVFVLMSR